MNAFFPFNFLCYCSTVFLLIPPLFLRHPKTSSVSANLLIYLFIDKAPSGASYWIQCPEKDENRLHCGKGNFEVLRR
ncbi:hypothetical protein BDB00DRAFT_829582 [Zychaea mexicana]|uniref:uncharacterized protein n=1 Tax=Zychaea mexicana TaxID=64656 RepID=UPI0022FEE973|nr:uncharacterized protein BDB00DRAFT_829582 [Zychaea mexicana]KAI9492186.1 hypothetical protein BDB00DRAFT_829582 [Zychaea mexicana]